LEKSSKESYDNKLLKKKLTFEGRMKKRLVELDFLRGVAILLVLFRHFHNARETIFFPGLYHIGWFGVDLFFVISGFLISNLLFKEKEKGKLNIKRFLVRRGFKIYPSFYALILFVIIVKMAEHKSLHIGNILAELFFFQNYKKGLLVHTWSLAVEEHFYLFLSLVFFLLSGANKKVFRISFLLLTIIILILCLLLRVNNLYRPFQLSTHIFETHIRIDSIFFGVFISFIRNYYRSVYDAINSKKIILYAIMLVQISTLFIFHVNSAYTYTLGFTLNYISSGCALMLLLNNTNEAFGRKGMTRAVSRIGYYSYTIYLWHIPVEAIFSKLNLYTHNYSFYLYFIVYCILSIITGVLMSKWIEEPFLKLRERLYK
jgi:peptidoglycan/LPS O-acetylase OafA/YrhL